MGSTCNIEWNWIINDRWKIKQNVSFQQSSDVFKIKKMHNYIGERQKPVVKFKQNNGNQGPDGMCMCGGDLDMVLDYHISLLSW